MTIEGLTEADLEGISDFMDIDAFQQDLDRQGVPYTLSGGTDG